MLDTDANYGGLLIRGENTTVATMLDLFGKGTPVRFWAERGMVKWEHVDKTKTRVTNGTVLWEDMAKRVLSLSEMVFKSGEDGYYADEKLKLQRFICDMQRVLEKAKEQGSPIQRGLISPTTEPKKVKLRPQEVDFTF